MSDTMTISTNNVPRPVLDAYELTPAEREDFDYLDWPAIERGEDSASFVRYRGTLYDLGDFMRVTTFTPSLEGWDGYVSDSFFSGVVLRYATDEQCSTYGDTWGEWVVMGTYYA